MRVYLDHNATTPLAGPVAEAMVRALRDVFGNPSSAHAEGSRARAALDAARQSVAALLGAEPDEVVFTAGATEANCTVLLGLLARPPGHVVSSAAEHPSVLAPLAALEAAGWRVTRLAVDGEGRLDPEALEEALAPGADLLSLLWANNETGVVQPMGAIAELARARGVPLHVDATQCVGKLPVDLSRLPADLLSLSGHKCNGPKGVGCLVVRRGAPLRPLLIGGPQERGRRGGTENVPAAVGLGVACALAREGLGGRAQATAALRDRLWQGIEAKIPRARRNGSATHVLPNTLNVAFEGASGELLLQALDLEGVAASSGAACHSGSIEPSHVLTAMGLSPARARASLRFSLGLGNDAGQVDHVLALLPDLVARAREAEPA